MQLAFRFILLCVALAYKGATASKVIPGLDWYNDAHEVHDLPMVMPTDWDLFHPIISGVWTHSFEDPGIIHMPSDYYQGSGMQNMNSHLASPPVTPAIPNPKYPEGSEVHTDYPGGSGMRTPTGHPQGSGMQTPINLAPPPVIRNPQGPAKLMDKNIPPRQSKFHKVVCTNCRTGQYRCDGGRPCETCQRRKITETCGDFPRKERATGHTTSLSETG